MKNFKFCLLSFFLMALTAFSQGRKTINFDANWQFTKGEIAGAEKSDFNDKTWRTLDVPHDWSIEGPYDRENPTARGGGYLPSGIGWYRKTFQLDEADSKKYFLSNLMA